MAQRGGGNALEVRVSDGSVALQCRVRTCGTYQRQVTAQAVGTQRHAQLRRTLAGRITDLYCI